MLELKSLVSDLEKATTEQGRIELLQKINEKLLTEYAIKVGSLTIVPLWVEAYYYHEKKFPDVTTHCRPNQKNHYEMLYQHAKTEINGGIDLCLSDKDDYYLSFLIKYALIDGEFYSQEKINGMLIKTGLDIENQKDVIIEYKRDGEIFHTQRIGLTNEKFKDLKLASMPINEIKNYPFDNKEKLVKTYLDEWFMAEREKKCKELLGYRSKYVIGN